MAGIDMILILHYRVYGDNEDIERYNVFHASLIIRHANDGKMYLYDILDIKKETSTPLEP